MINDPKHSTVLYKRPWFPDPDDEIRLAIYNSYLEYFETSFNATANGISFKPFDRKLNHWVSSQGDDFVLKTVSTKNNGDWKVRKSIQTVTHTKPFADYVDPRDLGIERNDTVNVSDDRINTKSTKSGIRQKAVTGNRKMNPIIRDGLKLNRAKVMAMFFVTNDHNLPFVAVIDGDVTNINAKNLYWCEKNLYPQLNIVYEPEDIGSDIVIHTPAIRAMQENFNLYGWEKVYTKITVPIPNDLIQFFKQWKISIQSAVFTALRFISQWSFCVYAIEYKEGQHVFIGYTPALDGVYVDQIFKVASEVPFLNEIIFSEGHGVLKLKYLTLSQTRSEAHDSCEKFMNQYHQKKWKIINNDFYSPHINRDITVTLKLSELDVINSKLMEKRGMDLQTYLDAIVRKLKD